MIGTLQRIIEAGLRLAFSQAGGIEVEVADQLQEIGLPVAENGLIAPLKNMARPAVPAVVVLAIGKLY